MKTPCPICAEILLRHLTHTRILWFCPRCRQEMPNFDLVKFSAIQEKIIQFGSYLNNCEAAYLKNKTQNSILAIEHHYTVIKLFIDVGRQRLEVVSLIVNQINIILINILAGTEYYIISTKNCLSQVETKNNKQNSLLKTDCLKDRKIILLYICQTILVVDNAILNNTSLQEIKAKSVNFKLTIDRYCFIDVIIPLWLFWGKMM